MKVRGLLCWATIGLLVVSCTSLSNESARNPTKPNGAGPFFQIRRGSKWGYMDRTGKVVIAPQFDDVGHFFNGRARVRVKTHWAYIDEFGKIVIAPRFDDAGNFTDRLAPVLMSRGWGYIDQRGTMVIPPSFQGAADFHEGLARTEIWNVIQCYENGRPTRYSKHDAPRYTYGMQSDIYHGINNTCYPLDSLVGYIDMTGQFVVPPRFFEARDFSDGRAVVRNFPGEYATYGYINRQGTLVSGFRFDDASSYSEGLASVCIGGRKVGDIRDYGRCGFIDRSGNFLIPALFASAGNFSEDRAAVSFYDRSGYGYINRRGTLVIPAEYSRVEAFSEGLAIACPDDHCVYIDPSGRAVISPVQAVWPFSDGLAVARLKEDTAPVYIDKTGRMVAPVETGRP